jgi:phospholipid transport system substrate-binding protein
MKKTLLIFFSFIISVNLYAVKEENIVQTMQKKVNEATKILSHKDEPIEIRAKKIFDKLENIFDINLMGKISLGRYWNTLSSKQQQEYNVAFERYMKNSYIDKLKLYNNQKITILNAQKIKSNRILVNSQIQGEKETYKIVYKFYKTQDDDWLIYDVDIIGVSIIKTSRAQFEDIMAHNSFEDLLKKLQR